MTKDQRLTAFDKLSSMASAKVLNERQEDGVRAFMPQAPIY